ncbi:MAG TPA: glutathione S-transferase family protein [Caldimonas sp.]|nr:glutathione S-transferase family protein [Caldimonas sp.]
MTIKLYSWPMSSGTRVSWALEELALPYEYVLLDAKKQEHRSAEMLALNPHGKVPALVDGELRLFESCAILLYLGSRYGAAKGLWPAPSGQSHADAVCWTVWASTELGPYLMQVVYHGLDSPVSYKPEDRSGAAAAYSRGQLERMLDTLEARLDGRDYLMGGFSLVDVAAASWLLLGTHLGLPLESHPRVAQWCRRCGERPAFRRAR